VEGSGRAVREERKRWRSWLDERYGVGVGGEGVGIGWKLGDGRRIDESTKVNGERGRGAIDWEGSNTRQRWDGMIRERWVDYRCCCRRDERKRRFD
jgi:hypothetical protein